MDRVEHVPERMDVYRCQKLAQNNGFDSATFDLVGPAGRLKCKWLDAYFGMFQAEGNDGFLMISDFDGPGIYVENFGASD